MKTLIKLLDKNLDYIKHCIEDDIIYIEVASNRDIVKCPYCGKYSSKVHSRYTKSFQDLPIGGKKVVINININNRKMFCENNSCNYKTFAESFDFIGNKAKKTDRLQKEIVNISMNVSSITASKILKDSIATVSKTTVCELLKKDRDKHKKRINNSSMY